MPRVTAVDIDVEALQAAGLYDAALQLLNAFVANRVALAAAGAPRGAAADDEDAEFTALVLRVLQALVSKDSMDWGDGGAGAVLLA